MDCFRTYFTHAQTCDNVRVKSATQWTASVHTLSMSQFVIMFLLEEWLNDLGGSSKNAIPLPLGAASLLLATQHTYLKKSIFFFVPRQSWMLSSHWFLQWIMAWTTMCGGGN